MACGGQNGQKPRDPSASNMLISHEGDEAVVSVFLPGLTSKHLERLIHRLKRISRLEHIHLAPLVSYIYSKEDSCLILKYFVGDAVPLSSLLKQAQEQTHEASCLTETIVVSLLLHVSSSLGFASSATRASLTNSTPQHHSCLTEDYLFIDIPARKTSVVAVGVYWAITQVEPAEDPHSIHVHFEKEDVFVLGSIANTVILQSTCSYSTLLKRIVELMRSKEPSQRPTFADLMTFLSSLVELQQTARNKARNQPSSQTEPVVESPSKLVRRTSTQVPNYQRSPSPQATINTSFIHKSPNPNTTPCELRGNRLATMQPSYTAPLRRPGSVLQMYPLPFSQQQRKNTNRKSVPPSLDIPLLNRVISPVKTDCRTNPLLDAVYNANITEVRRLKTIFTGSTDEENNSALIIAIQLRHTDIALELLPLEYSKTNSKGQTPLMVSLLVKLDAVSTELLLNYENLYGSVDADGNSALMYAVLSNCRKAVELLAPYEHSISNKHGKYPIHIAIENRFLDLAFYLLDYNHTVLDAEYKTLSEYCDIYNCSVINDRIMTITKQKFGASTNYTALMVAAGLNNIDDLYKYIPSQAGSRHSSGETALIIAIRKNQLDAIQILLPYEFYLPDKNGHFFVYQAAATGSRQTILHVLDCLFSDIMLACLQFDEGLSEVAEELRIIISDALAANDNDTLQTCVLDLDSIIGHQVETGAFALYYSDLLVAPSTPLLAPESAIHLGETDLDIHALDISNAHAYGEATTNSTLPGRTIMHMSRTPRDFISPSQTSLRHVHPCESSLSPKRTLPVITPLLEKFSTERSTIELPISQSHESQDTHSSTGSLSSKKRARILLKADSSDFRDLSESLQLPGQSHSNSNADEYGNAFPVPAIISSTIKVSQSDVDKGTELGTTNNKGGQTL